MYFMYFLALLYSGCDTWRQYELTNAVVEILAQMSKFSFQERHRCCELFH